MDLETAAPGQPLVIRSCWNDDLALAIVSGRAVIKWLDPTDPDQRWDSIGIPRPAVIRNVGAGAPVGVASVSAGAPLMLSSFNNQWLVEAYGSPAHCILTGGSRLVMGIKGPNFNAGSEAVLVNENATDLSQQWVFSLASSIPAPVTEMVSIDGAQFAMLEDGSRYTIDTYNPNDHRYHYRMTTWSTGTTFQNRATGHYIGYAGDNVKLRAYASLCVEALWDKVPHEEKDWFRFRSVTHSNMYINAMNTDRAPVQGSDLNTAAYPGQFACQMWRTEHVYQ